MSDMVYSLQRYLSISKLDATVEYKERVYWLSFGDEQLFEPGV